jgi:hypothetical protein
MEAPLLPGFKLDQTFFGFKPKDRIQLHENLFNLIWAGEGRWSWETVYHMPIPIRKLWIKKVNDITALKQQTQQKQNTQTTSARSKIAKPGNASKFK